MNILLRFVKVLRPILLNLRPLGSHSPLDPYDNYFRVRLVCTLLDTCGQYFDRGSGKKKLDAFLVFFQVGRLPHVAHQLELLHRISPCNDFLFSAT